MSKRKNTRTSTDRLNKSKRENQKLRTLVSRQRRNLKDLVSVLNGAKRAMDNGDIIRAAAILSTNYKYPPSAAIECNHEWTNGYMEFCAHCKEIKS